MTKTDVIIPARNEAKTIGPIVETLADNPNVGQIIVCCDSCDDDTDMYALMHGAHHALISKWGGKGQAVMAGLDLVATDYVMFCDADYTGLTQEHIDAVLCHCPGMVVGIPDIPPEYPEHRLWAWPWCSGIRAVPTVLTLPLILHGYLMETQLNLAAKHAQIGVRFAWLHGLKSPWNMSEERIAAMQADYEWGKEHGVT
jgi:glycosyltransferase involved in cell wall biosynthesis